MDMSAIKLEQRVQTFQILTEASIVNFFKQLISWNSMSWYLLDRLPQWTNLYGYIYHFNCNSLFSYSTDLWRCFRFQRVVL